MTLIHSRNNTNTFFFFFRCPLLEVHRFPGPEDEFGQGFDLCIQSASALRGPGVQRWIALHVQPHRALGSQACEPLVLIPSRNYCKYSNSI